MYDMLKCMGIASMAEENLVYLTFSSSHVAMTVFTGQMLYS